MKNDIWLSSAVGILEKSGISTARLDCLVLLEDVTGKDRSWLLAHPEFELAAIQIKKLDDFIKRRAEHEPLAYIRNKTEFYGREFYIDHRVLEPRPESETMIDILKNTLHQNPLRQGSRLTQKFKIIDVGTGSGALAITAKLELPNVNIVATDIDEKCLAVARENAQNLKADITFLQANLLNFPPSTIHYLPSTKFGILANLPYVPDDFHINQAAMREPSTAIFGGLDGLDLYRKLFRQIQNMALSPRFVLTEALPPQHKKLATIAKATAYQLEKTDDFIQLFRLLNN